MRSRHPTLQCHLWTLALLLAPAFSAADDIDWVIAPYIWLPHISLDQSVDSGGGGGGGYAAPSYGGQNYGGAAAYSSPAAQGGGYGSQYGQYGGGSEGYQVRLVLFLVDNDGPSQIVAKLDFAVFLVVGIWTQFVIPYSCDRCLFIRGPLEDFGIFVVGISVGHDATPTFCHLSAMYPSYLVLSQICLFLSSIHNTIRTFISGW